MADPRQHPPKSNSWEDLSGRELGDFQLLRRLGRGAMAEVYLAEQRQLKRRVAVKILKPELAHDTTYLERFRREAQAAASLVHANIVQIYEVGHRDGFHYIAQEYVQGQNLAEWLNRNGPPNLPKALSIIRQAAAALAKAGELGVVHRDIKLENIMVTSAGEVKVADFGLARVTRPGEATDLTQVGITMGTPLYMSPEQVEGRALDPRSDLYSLGVTCYHLLAGGPPFRGETALSVAVQHLKTMPEPLENVRPDLPPALCRIVHRLLAKNPNDRYQSGGELLGELRHVYLAHVADDWPDVSADWSGLEKDSSADAAVQLTAELDGLMKTAAAQRRTSRRTGRLVAAIVAGLLLGGLAAWLATNRRPLLAETQSAVTSIPRQRTALQQYLDASRIGTEEAWRAVIEYFPEKDRYTYPAKQQLARLYLQQGDYDRAWAIFEEFANLQAPGQQPLRAFGLAGQYGVLTLQGKDRQAASVLNQLWPMRRFLVDRQMQQLLQYALKKNRDKLGTGPADQWEQWLAQEFQEEE